MSKQHGADMCESRCIWRVSSKRVSSKLCSAHVPYAQGAPCTPLCASAVATRNDCVLLKQVLRDEAAICGAPETHTECSLVAVTS